jgi:alpha-tubulin suppressor-like RCC1 family protein
MRAFFAAIGFALLTASASLPLPPKVLSLVSGDHHNCALLEGGKLKCWGNNGSGRLGIGSTDSMGDAPNELGDRLPYVSLGGSGRTVARLWPSLNLHTCASLDDGSLKCWGSNTNGELGLGDTNERGSRIGQMGESLPSVDLGMNRPVRQASAGGSHTCAILEDRSLKCWGWNSSGQLGLGDNRQRGNTSASMGANLPAVNLGSGRTAVQVAAGGTHTCAILDDGSLKCWGSNTNGELGLGDSRERGRAAADMGDRLPAVKLGRRTVQVGAGDGFTCALLDNGRVKCWGDNSNGQLGQGDVRPRGAAAGDMAALAEIDIEPGLPVTSISVSRRHVCALLVAGYAKCWGANDYGQLGQGDQESRGDRAEEMGQYLPPIDLGAFREAVEVSTGTYHTCVRFSNGSVKCFGDNCSGHLGLGDARPRGTYSGEMGDVLPEAKL